MNKVFSVYICACGYYQIKQQIWLDAAIEKAARGYPYFDTFEDATKATIKRNEHLISEAIKYNNLIKKAL